MKETGSDKQYDTPQFPTKYLVIFLESRQEKKLPAHRDLLHVSPRLGIESDA